MEEQNSASIVGDIETIVVKPEPIESLIEIDDPLWLEENSATEIDLQSDTFVNNGENFNGTYFVASTGEVVTVSDGECSSTGCFVQIPFYLENYFKDDNSNDNTATIYEINQVSNKQDKIMVSEIDKINEIKENPEIDRETCYECDITFPSEQKLLEHLMIHIDIGKMGCVTCDKTLKFDEKYQLHLMTVTWQSIYYCDFCRKSCAGVVRSKTQPTPPGKTYMCHDCELQEQEDFNIGRKEWSECEIVDSSENSELIESQSNLKSSQNICEMESVTCEYQLSETEVVQHKKHKKIIAKHNPKVDNAFSKPQKSPLTDITIVEDNESKKIPSCTLVNSSKTEGQVILPKKSPQHTSKKESLILISDSQITEKEIELNKKAKKCTTDQNIKVDKLIIKSKQSPPSKELTLENKSTKISTETSAKSKKLKECKSENSELNSCFYTSSTQSAKKKENKNCKIASKNREIKRINKRSDDIKYRTRQKFKCTYCPLKFSQKCILKSHLEDKHKLYNLKYECKVCGKEFKQQKCVENHVNCHKNLKKKNNLLRNCNKESDRKCNLLKFSNS